MANEVKKAEEIEKREAVKPQGTEDTIEREAVKPQGIEDTVKKAEAGESYGLFNYLQGKAKTQSKTTEQKQVN